MRRNLFQILVSALGLAVLWPTVGAEPAQAVLALVNSPETQVLVVTVVWRPGDQPGNGEARVIVQENLHKEKFYKEFIDLMTRPTSAAQK